MCLSNDSIDAAYETYQRELVAAGLLIPLGAPGLYGRSGVFEGVIEHFEQLVTRIGAPLKAEVMRFPPLFSRQHYLALDHIETFPNLLGSVHSFVGKDREHLEML